MFLIPVMLVHDVNFAALSLAAAFFFVELVVAPIWAVPMDIAPKYSGSASGMMNFGFGLAGIISPFVFGYLDRPDRELDPAVRRLDLPFAARRRSGVSNAPGPAVRGGGDF